MLPMPCYGQPIASTHPHLIHGKEVMPGLELDEFKERRAKFLTNIQKVYAEKFPNYGRNKRAHLVSKRERGARRSQLNINYIEIAIIALYR